MFDLRKWMSLLPDNAPLTQLLIPGTHDSCARSGIGAKCQATSLEEQLNNGIRFLDIRCRHYKDEFPIHHGAFYQDINFNDVLKTCKAFLAENPKECILLCMKEEHDAEGNSKTFEQVVWDYINSADSPPWYTSSQNPILGEVRGRLILVRRFTGSCGLDWAKFSVQDDYELGTRNLKTAGDYDPKERAIIAEFERAKADRAGQTFHVNFASGYWVGLGVGGQLTNVNLTAEEMNPRVLRYLATLAGRDDHIGCIIPMDFAQQFQTVTNRMVFLSLRRFKALPGRSCRIRNVKHGEYLYASAITDDSKRRYVFTDRSGKSDYPEAVWRVADLPGGTVILSEAHMEYLYDSGCELERGNRDRHMVFTWRPGGIDADAYWRIEWGEADRAGQFYNHHHQRYTYAADYKPYDDQRRRVLSWGKGEPVDQGVWQFEWL